MTRIAYSRRLNPSKYAALEEQARRLGRVRSQVWQRYGSLAGVGLTDRRVRDRWLSDGTQIVVRADQQRADRHRTRLPVQDSSTTRRAESETSECSPTSNE